ncbi:hypothetical protein TNIN_295361 [Trichonephila inaurata madagascariensis]|uniref:Uncharacterized protein n=1 Tax=Trichonephila inaurata madagascariensis TaxID=2747483 RepID=A0A8X7CK65_9ARAC|nr:hypothetical protein TNIN_295361 [Trichonephila inaurata madagascariensis]
MPTASSVSYHGLSTRVFDCDSALFRATSLGRSPKLLTLYEFLELTTDQHQDNGNGMDLSLPPSAHNSRPGTPRLYLSTASGSCLPDKKGNDSHELPRMLSDTMELTTMNP